MTELVNAVYNVSTFTQDIATERENQAKPLDALILLDNEDYIFLNSYTDESLITIKVPIK